MKPELSAIFQNILKPKEIAIFYSIHWKWRLGITMLKLTDNKTQFNNQQQYKHFLNSYKNTLQKLFLRSGTHSVKSYNDNWFFSHWFINISFPIFPPICQDSRWKPKQPLRKKKKKCKIPLLPKFLTRVLLWEFLGNFFLTVNTLLSIEM